MALYPLVEVYASCLLAVSIFSHIADYQNIAVLKNQNNELIDEQMTAPADRFITVELDKFTKGLSDIESDLDKLIYTMKTVHEVNEPTQFPQFWNEEWLQVAIKELDKRAFTPEQRLSYEMTISANALAIKNEKKKIQDAVEQKEIETIKTALSMGLTLEQSAGLAGVSVSVAESIRHQFITN